MYACIYLPICKYPCICVHMYVYIHPCKYVFNHVNMCVCIFTYLWSTLLVLLMTPKSRIEDFSAGHIISKNLDSCSSQDSALDKNLRTVDKVKHSYSIDFCQIAYLDRNNNWEETFFACLDVWCAWPFIEFSWCKIPSWNSLLNVTFLTAPDILHFLWWYFLPM